MNVFISLYNIVEWTNVEEEDDPIFQHRIRYKLAGSTDVWSRQNVDYPTNTYTTPVIADGTYTFEVNNNKKNKKKIFKIFFFFIYKSMSI